MIRNVVENPKYRILISEGGGADRAWLSGFRAWWGEDRGFPLRRPPPGRGQATWHSPFARQRRRTCRAVVRRTPGGGSLVGVPSAGVALNEPCTSSARGRASGRSRSRRIRVSCSRASSRASRWRICRTASARVAGSYCTRARSEPTRPPCAAVFSSSSSRGAARPTLPPMNGAPLLRPG